MDKFKRDAENLNNKKLEIEAKLSLDEADYQRKIKEIERKRQAEIKANTNTWGTIDTSKELQINTKYDNQIANLGLKMEASIDKADYKLKEIEDQLSKNKTKQDELNNSIDKMNSKLNHTNKYDEITDSINTVNKSMTNTIKKVGKWALAIFGVRSAYMLIRNSASTLSQYNEQIGDDLEYIRYALASSMQPLIEKLISLAYKLLGYINMIADAWFNVDLFANASAKNMKKASKDAKDTANALLGFDEVNKLEDNSNSNSNNIPSPNVDLSNMDMPVPGWLKFIIDNKDIILSLLGGIAAGLLAIKLGVEGIKGLGIGILISGIILLLQSIIEYLNDPSWENFGKIIESIGLIVLGFGVILGSIPAIITGICLAIVGLVVSNWEKIKNLLQTAIDWIDSKMEWIKENFGAVGIWIAEIFKGAISIVLDVFDGLFTGVKQILDGILKIFKGDFKGGLTSIVKGIGNILIGIINGLIDGINAIVTPIRGLIVGIGKVLGKSWTLDNIKIPKIKKLKSGGIIDVPRKGVPLAQNVVGGEAGAEGVLPLTNPETMARLGKEIGQWITLNLDITNEMDGRILNRRLENIKARDNFARNGG